MPETKSTKLQFVDPEPEGDNVCEKCRTSFIGASALCLDCEDDQNAEEEAS